MRLKSFRIYNCFGFKDSGGIKFETKNKEELYYIIGRNSSGKSSLLKAIRNFEYDLIPENNPSFQNYKDTGEDSRLEAVFQIKKNDIDVKTQIRFIKEELFLPIGIDQAIIDSNPNLQEFFLSLESIYKEFIKGFGQEIPVIKLKNGDYIFGNNDKYLERISSLTEIINHLFNYIQQDKRFIRIENRTFPLNFSALTIENLLFRQFPQIDFFDKEFDFTASLPNQIILENINDFDNQPELIRTFIEFLGIENLKKYLGSSDQDLHETLENEFNDKLKKLLNESEFKFLEITVRRNQGLQITTRTQNKSSFFFHLSDNTKFLFHYYLYAKVNEINNGILLFDEPNNGFHATAQFDLLNYLKKLSLKNTVIMSTHSEYMIDYDLLENIRRMTKDHNNELLVYNDFRNEITKKGEYLSLQPLAEAIGLKYINQLKINDKVVITEGLSDLYYIRAMAKLTKNTNITNILPARGDSSMLTIVPFVISQGLNFKVILDTNSKTNYRKLLEEDYGIESKTMYTIPPYKKNSDSGIEDIFSKEDFQKYVLGEDLKDDDSIKYNKMSNSSFVILKKYNKKALAYKFLCLTSKLSFNNLEAETKKNIKDLISFTLNTSWTKISCD